MATGAGDEVLSLDLSTSSPYVALGDSVQLTAVVTGDRARATGGAVEWSSSDPKIATVTGTGVIHARDEGEAIVTARSGGQEGTIVIAVVPPLHTVRLINFDAAGNRLTRFDLDGNAIDAHGGEIRSFDGTYYWYGEHYGCGYQWITPGAPFCGFKVYTSPDLIRWTDRGFLFDPTTNLWQAWCDGRTSGCFRPHVERSRATGNYVLWINAYETTGGFWVFESTSPVGPFELRDPPRLVVGDRPNRGDGNLFVDAGGTGYVAYTHWLPGGDIVIEELTPDLLSGTGRHVELGLRNVEAPALFRRGDRYYLTVADPNCGYCTTGTSYLTAAHPLGPWSALRRISPNSCGGQPTHVSELPAAGGGRWYLYQSDLWNRGEYNEATADQFWTPLSFDAAGEILPIVCAPTIYGPVVVGEAGGESGEPDRFRLACDIGAVAPGGRVQRELRFSAAAPGRLESLEFSPFQRGARNSLEGGSPDTPLRVEVRSRTEGTILRSVEIAPGGVGWSPRRISVPIDLDLTAGDYAIRLSAEPTRGCYGLPYRDDLPRTGPESHVSLDGGESWEPEPGRTIAFGLTLRGS